MSAPFRPPDHDPFYRSGGGGLRPLRARDFLVGSLALVIAIILGFSLLFGGIPGLPGPASSPHGPPPDSYAIVFNESGLPNGTGWSVTLGGNFQRSSSDTMTFFEPNGTFSFNVSPASGLNASEPWGSVHVHGTTVCLPLVFSTEVPLVTRLLWTGAYNVTTNSWPSCPSYCYSVAFDAKSINTSDVEIALENGGGRVLAWPQGINVSLLSSDHSGPGVAAVYDTWTSAWLLLYPFNGTLTGGGAVTLTTSSIGPSYGLGGDYLVAIGEEGFAGTETSPAL